MHEMLTLDKRQAVRKSMVVSFAVVIDNYRGNAVNIELSDGTSRMIYVHKNLDPCVTMQDLIREMNRNTSAGSIDVSSYQQ